MKIRTIEALYKGQRFRSRLEARWAMFFDHMDVDWEYEPEAFMLSDNTRYAPNFWLPGQGIFAEVRLVPDGFSTALKFAVESGYSVALLIGSPGIRPIALIDPDYGEITDLLFDGRYDRSIYINTGSGPSYSVDYLEELERQHRDIVCAVHAARSARFQERHRR